MPPRAASSADLDAIIREGLERTGGGDLAARLVPYVYDELRRIAQAQRRRSGAPDTVDTTALVHEAYLRLAGRDLVPDRAYFFASAARAMRNVLVDHARRRNARPQGHGVTLNTALYGDEALVLEAAHLIDIDDALGQLAEFDERAAQVVECRFFGGLTVEETAEAVGVGSATVKRDWRRARAWLLAHLGDPPALPDDP
jgi:RNA polymerase sigma factor (TIGR02999 family)